MSMAQHHDLRQVSAERNLRVEPVLLARAGGPDTIMGTPIAASEARNVLAKLEVNSRTHGGGGGSESRVIVFMHVAGGAGATTLAVNVGCALSQSNPHQETCLLDLDLQFGSAANLMDISHVSPVLDFVEDPSRMDCTMLEGMMAQHPSGLRVLTSPRLPIPLHALTPAGIGELLQVAKSQYRNIVVDMPVALAPWTETVLKAATIIYLVTPLTVPAAHRLTKFFNLLRNEKLSHLPIKIVVNRYNITAKSGANIGTAEFSKTIGQDLNHLIPDDHDVVSLAQNQGTPALRLKPKSKFSVAVQKMVDADIKVSDGVRPASWFRLFRS